VETVVAMVATRTSDSPLPSSTTARGSRNGGGASSSGGPDGGKLKESSPY